MRSLLPVVLAASIASAPAAVEGAPVTAFFQMCGMDTNGPSIGSAKTQFPDTCPFLCAVQSSCGAATWSDYEGGTCWFKDRPHPVVPNPGTVSFYMVVGGQPDKGPYGEAYPYDCQSNVDIPGYDIGSARGGNIDICKGYCALTKNCFAVVWTDYNGGTCWMKSRANNVAPKAGARSCFIQRVWRESGLCPRL